MNNIINSFLLGGDTFISEMHLRQPDLCMVLLDHSQKPKQECNNFKKDETLHIFIRIKQIGPVFKMIWLMKILEIYQEKWRLRKYFKVRRSRFPVIHSMMDINADFLSSLIRRLGTLIKHGLKSFLKIEHYQIHYSESSAEIFRGVEYSHLIEITFGVLIFKTCS